MTTCCQNTIAAAMHSLADWIAENDAADCIEGIDFEAGRLSVNLKRGGLELFFSGQDAAVEPIGSIEETLTVSTCFAEFWEFREFSGERGVVKVGERP